MKATVIYHSADFDGLFCREIAKRFLPKDTEFIGWNFGDKQLDVPKEGMIYVLDLPIDRPFGAVFMPADGYPVITAVRSESAPDHAYRLDSALSDKRFIWIDHHASSIESHPNNIPGYRIDGVAACRLAWQWFTIETGASESDGERIPLPSKQDFIDRKVPEPLAVRLAGEYDVFDRRDPMAELFQFGLRSEDLGATGTWNVILGWNHTAERMVQELLSRAPYMKFARDEEYREVITSQGFDMDFQGIKFLACNSHECDIRSQLFEAGIKPHHEALLGFTYTGKAWRVSMYQIPGKDTDILSIAKSFGGGGHKGACGCEIPAEFDLRETTL